MQRIDCESMIAATSLLAFFLKRYGYIRPQEFRCPSLTNVGTAVDGRKPSGFPEQN
jgi:hypothetical protein